MNPTPQKIKQARQANSMTQKQLASALNVSRQTVSHWENGRVKPDEDTLAQLDALLHLSDMQPACVQPRLHTKSFLIGFACGTLAALLIAIAVFAAAMRPVSAPPQTPSEQQAAAPKINERFTPAFYQQENVREEGKAYLLFSLVQDPITVIERDQEPYVGWEVDYRFEEMNGVGFTITAFTEVYFTAEGDVTYSAVFKDEELAIPLDFTDLPARGRTRYSVFKPVDATTLYAVCIEGVDSNGNELLFRYSIPLQQGSAQ